jgi:riboflavin biosynthesis pyrimidine reductase
MRALLALATATAALTAPQRCEVTLKIAMDRNGAVDDLGDKAERFTSPASLDAVHRLRRHCDAVLVGASTVARDDPSLTVRRVPLAPRTTQPLRVVLGRAPADAGLLTDGLETVVFSKDDLDGAGAAALPGVLRELHRKGVRHLMVEGGPQTARYFLDAGLVDRAIVVRAPVAFADKPVPSGITAETLRNAGLSFHSRRDVGGDDTHVWTRGAHAPLWGMLLTRDEEEDPA